MRNDMNIKPVCPVIDAHNHLWGNIDSAGLVDIMNRAGVVGFCELTANVKIEFKAGGTQIAQCDISDFFANYIEKFPGRFYCFTMANFAAPIDKPLITNWDSFVGQAIDILEDHVAMGAKGLKILKELGLHHKDSDGNLIDIDDERLGAIWAKAAELKIPVLMHQADPTAFFEPVTPDNEHYESLKKYTTWSFCDEAKFPRKSQLLQRRDNVIKRHRDTIFILPHLANNAEDIDSVDRLLEENSNVYVDFSARIDELGRKPEQARDFFEKWQNRIIFGSDMPASLEVFQAYYRFLQTTDEGIIPPDYDGTFDRYRWKISGLGLDKTILEKIYYKNILEIIPSLKEELNL